MSSDPASRRTYVLFGLGCAALALAFALWARRSHPAANQATAAEANARAHGRAGSRGGPYDAHRAPRQGSAKLARIRGTVVDAATSHAVGGGEVVFSSGRGEVTTRADADGSYEVFVPPGAYHPFVRGKGFASAGEAPPERVRTPPRMPEGGPSAVDLAPLVVVTDDASGVDLHVLTSTVVTGHVANRSGQPVAHAVVRARGDVRPVLATDVAETDADGAFQLELPSGSYSVEASHPDYAGVQGSSVALQIESGREPSPMSLTLVAGCVVEGKVVGVDGAPRGDGSVDYRTPSMSDFNLSTSIAHDGTFRWTSVDEGEVSLRAWPWMSPPTEPQTFQCTDGARFTTTLRLPGATSDVDGTLVSAGGAAVPFAFIDIIALSPGAVTQQERADEKGDWAVFSMPAGQYLITAAVPGKGFVERHITVPSHDVELVLGGTGSIAGTIAGVADGAVSMDVSACELHPSRFRPTRSDVRLVSVHDGRFRIDGVAACQLSVSARAGGESALVNVTVGRGGATAASLDLAPKPAIAIDDPRVEPAPEEPTRDVPAIQDDGPAPEPATPEAAPQEAAPEEAAPQEAAPQEDPPPDATEID
ncbi:MAG TPA: carboxypeptidase regulatory-like domain-containing protein [Byssovorax sp.]